MPGKPGARKGDSVTCPRCGETTISTGSSNVLFDGLPAASQGDCTGCGSELNSRVIANVLINGRPAVVVDLESDHDGVVIGGSGTVLIGGEFTSASLNQQPITVSPARSANPLPPTLPGRFIPWEERNSDLVAADIEEEEEEEYEQEDETAVGVTLRIGVFFDGTGNNAGNTAVGALCGASMRSSRKMWMPAASLT
ncbi:PAAR domain-containing protein [Pseudomonas silesiensis]|uniref:PAAR domain-containing protein n=1 Tax=Pseudomonas silesiensis TaxID=1853130 RepID=UPI0030CBE64E